MASIPRELKEALEKHRPRVLIVDDSPAMRLAVGATLQQAGYEVLECASGEEAIAALDRDVRIVPDLCILDYAMAGMDGVSLARKLRMRPGMRYTPILMLSTQPVSERREEAKAAGVTGWMAKPIAGVELLRFVNRVCPAP
jgi:two-component system chemotaxis response regulator CheY